MAEVLTGGTKVVAQVCGFAFQRLVTFFQRIGRLVQMVARTVDTVRQTIRPFPGPVLIGPGPIDRLRHRRPVLAHHQPQQTHRGQHRRHGVVAHAGAEVSDKRRAIVLHQAPGLVEHLTGGELALQLVDDVADAGALRVDFPFDLLGTLLRFEIQFSVLETFLRSAS